ncbi:FAD/NAD(P)-binding oxidoreductase [Erwinia pyrifoliae]|uniref:NAD(P)/FAD-dependent oxidoreductase n=1 Tax=Erwinia pyrifoliae TaxID=79967 RepID=A0ABY5XAN0_ERWPY|nr:FAD/NAD(P)-binding oxidoreductase [Erwinia pyrifoliae]AUX73408.1 NAD(P)/FAD-dependent oxidoreductase [Erwinia pyrifoliae]MCA8876294.1 NAD(P)/FAD-dependent oxidoreductase [Erwinia pyrifoliae]MCT2386434.1 NAD(P)/FAD-dependent oxidoreductase [Erwinia pyrifoliae]MCU8587969.1 NAD(P)/FAD-dependent oxidoreductase [Erwinia pyrifoliae]UWS28374.1 NAD(P)/FAD-dependent oxidoreductase [Erwinia pyrifoliae]
MNKLAANVLIIGAGPAGMAAAIAAASTGADVLVIDDNPRPGGQIWRAGPGSRLPRVALKHLENFLHDPRIKLLPQTRLIMQVAPEQFLLETPDKALQVTAGRLIICSGARELFIPFPGWTLPGVTGAGGLQALIKSGLDVSGQRVVIAGSGPLLLASAHSAGKQGAKVVQICEQQNIRTLSRMLAQLWRWPGKVAQALALSNLHYRPASYVVSAHGEGKLEYVMINQRGRLRKVYCDRLACGYGLRPNVQIAQLLGVNTARGAVVVNSDQQTTCAHIYAAGECTGVGGSELSLAEGFIAGFQAIGAWQKCAPWRQAKSSWSRFAGLLQQTFELDERLKTLVTDETILCRCEDVAFGSVKNAAGLKQAKMQTRCGMGACQGKICHASLGWLKNWSAEQARPPIVTARLETLCLPDDTPPYPLKIQE